MLSPPIPDSYIVSGTRIAAGEYPGSPPGTVVDGETKLAAFLDAGIDAFVPLTGPEDTLAPYAPALQALAGRRGLTVSHEQFTIPDMDVCAEPLRKL